MEAVVFLILIVFILAGLWRMFSKAGKPGWMCLIPILNIVVLINIAGKPWWWILLLFIPFVNFFVQIIVYVEIAKAFGQGFLFGLGMAFLGFIFIPIIGFGGATYTRPNTGVPA